MQNLSGGSRPSRRSQRFVHVAGTNRQRFDQRDDCLGSSAKAGLRTGLYTSPHLIEPTERIHIDGAAVTTEHFADASLVHQTAEQMLTAGTVGCPSLLFRNRNGHGIAAFQKTCDICVIEVGLGGRLDATNVIRPELCVITPVAYDHEAYLGNTFRSIAFEKAGILKAGVPSIMANRNRCSASDRRIAPAN